MQITDKEYLNFHVNLSEQQYQYMPRLRCPCCAADKWGINRTVFALGEMFPNPANPNQQITPVLLRTCEACGYVMMYNGIVAGINFPKPEEAKPVDQVKGEDGEPALPLTDTQPTKEV